MVNTVAQYIRTGANVILVLIATRLILRALGESDFGIYSLVAGVVSMMSYFTNALTTTTQRYLSYNQGSDNIEIRRSYFLNSVAIHILLGIAFIIILLLCIPLLFNGFLNIAYNRLPDAIIVYCSMIAMLFIALLSSPFRAVLISHENIVYISIIDVLDGVLKMTIGLILLSFNGNRLVFYAFLMIVVSVINILCYGIYCVSKYDDCKKLKFRMLDKCRSKELTSFASWTIYGTLCLFGRVQGIALVLNKFFSTVVNASYGISLQVNAALGTISGALQTALAPQLIQAEGNHNRPLMLRLSEIGCKMSFILLSLVAFPILFNISHILTLWLGEIPEYCGLFCTVLIISNLFDQLTVGFNSTMNAVGRIRNFMIVVNTIKLSTVLIMALLLYIGLNIYIAFYSYVFIEVLGCILRIYFCKKNAGLNVYQYCKNVLLRLIVPTLFIIVAYWLGTYTSFNAILFTAEVVLISTSFLFLTFKMGLCNDERQIAGNFIHKIIKKR